MLQPPPLDTCPLWQVVRFLNQTGAWLLAECETTGGAALPPAPRLCFSAPRARPPSIHPTLCCTGIPIPGPLTDLYFGTGAAGYEALRADAATYLLTWQCQRFMLCLSHVDGLRMRM